MRAGILLGFVSPRQCLLISLCDNILGIPHHEWRLRPDFSTRTSVSMSGSIHAYHAPRANPGLCCARISKYPGPLWLGRAETGAFWPFLTMGCQSSAGGQPANLDKKIGRLPGFTRPERRGRSEPHPTPGAISCTNPTGRLSARTKLRRFRIPGPCRLPNALDSPVERRHRA